MSSIWCNFKIILTSFQPCKNIYLNPKSISFQYRFDITLTSFQTCYDIEFRYKHQIDVISISLWSCTLIEMILFLDGNCNLTNVDIRSIWCGFNIILTLNLACSNTKFNPILISLQCRFDIILASLQPCYDIGFRYKHQIDVFSILLWSYTLFSILFWGQYDI